MTRTIPVDARVFLVVGEVNLPENWSRDTDFNDRYLQGSPTPNVNGGSSTHAHTSSHSHTESAHVHVCSGGNNTGSVLALATAAFNTTPHTHSHSVFNSASVTGSSDSTSITSTSNDAQPPYITAILIKPVDGNQLLPSGCIVYSNRTTVENLFLSNGTLYDLDHRFATVDFTGLIIKPAPTGDTGGTTGGFGNHLHTLADHNHNMNAHSHAAIDVTAEIVPATGARVGTDVNSTGAGTHHTLALDSNGGTYNNQTVIPNSVSTMPYCMALYAFMNPTSDPVEPGEGSIIPYIGDPANLNNDWVLCDGTTAPDMTTCQVYCMTEPYEDITDFGVVFVGGFTGADNHNHSSSPHVHTGAAHNHTSQATVSNSVGKQTGVKAVPINTHTHVWTVNNATPTVNSTVLTLTVADKRYYYRTVHWIMAQTNTVYLKEGIIKGARIL